MKTPPRGNPMVVFALPARASAEAVSRSVTRLLALEYNRYPVVVVDCGDGAMAKAATAAAVGDPRILAGTGRRMRHSPEPQAA